MNKLRFFLYFLLFFISKASYSQSYSEDFESYSVLDKISRVSSNWRTWQPDYSPANDAVIVTSQAQSGTKSLYLFSNRSSGGPIDVLMDFGGGYVDGIVDVGFSIMVQKGAGAYFSIQSYEEAGKLVPIEVSIVNEELELTVNDSTTTRPFKHDAWTSIRLKFDLDKNIHHFLIDGESILTFELTQPSNRVASINFYPYNVSPTSSKAAFWIDDVELERQENKYEIDNISVLDGQGTKGLAGSESSLTFQVINRSNSVVSDFRYECNYGSSEWIEEVKELDWQPGSELFIQVENKIKLIAGEKDAFVEILDYNNGQVDGKQDDNRLKFNSGLVTPHQAKAVLIEEGTGTWCQWCTRGIVTLKAIDKEFGVLAIPIAVHYGDPMAAQFYAQDLNDTEFDNSYPRASINRSTKTDTELTPTRLSILEELEKTPTASFEIAAQDSSSDVLSVTVDYHFLSDVDENWRVACILSEENVKGVGSDYDQANAYAGGLFGPMGGFESKPRIIPASEMEYDHVARAMVPNSFGARVFEHQYHAGESKSFTFNFVLKDEWTTNNLFLTPVLIKPDGSIDNAGRVSIKTAKENAFKKGEIIAKSSRPDAKFSVYPNPAKSFVFINLPNDMETEIQSVQVLGSSGKVMAYYSIRGSQKIDLMGIPAGFYVISIPGIGHKTLVIQ